MDAVKYLKERNRMCEVTGYSCESCYLVKKTGETCWTLESDDIDEVIKTVGDWSKEHPIKTRQTEFLKQFPNARIDKEIGILDIMSCAADENVMICDKDGDCKKYMADGDCGNCMRDYWSEEVK